VGRVHVGAQPQAGIGDANGRRRDPVGDLAERWRHLRGLEQLLDAQCRRLLLSPARGQPRFDERVVVVAGDEYELLVRRGREHACEILEEGTRGRHGLVHRPVAQLEHVAEQHHALDVGDGLQQRRAQILATQQVGARAAAEVQVGDD